MNAFDVTANDYLAMHAHFIRGLWEHYLGALVADYRLTITPGVMYASVVTRWRGGDHATDTREIGPFVVHFLATPSWDLDHAQPVGKQDTDLLVKHVRVTVNEDFLRMVNEVGVQAAEAAYELPDELEPFAWTA